MYNLRLGSIHIQKYVCGTWYAILAELHADLFSHHAINSPLEVYDHAINSPLEVYDVYVAVDKGE